MVERPLTDTWKNDVPSKVYAAIRPAVALCGGGPLRVVVGREAVFSACLTVMISVQRFWESHSPSRKRIALPIASRCILPQEFSILSDQPDGEQLRHDAITLVGAHFMTRTAQLSFGQAV